MAEAASEHHHGDQPVSEQLSSYRLFQTMAKWSALHLGVLILVLSLWFCVGENFLGGLIPGIVVLALGIWFLRSKPPAEH
ncbi:MAG TPA: aa3-type cytochrome c oxidase subunit IV [Caulobacteraceae bacterium]